MNEDGLQNIKPFVDRDYERYHFPSLYVPDRIGRFKHLRIVIVRGEAANRRNCAI
jgi:hypothetical protein